MPAQITPFKTGILISSMLVAGCANSLLSKYQDMQDVGGGKKYEQPVFQTLTMFVGETLCLGAFLAMRSGKRIHKGLQKKRRKQPGDYRKLAMVDDSGVVLNDTEITIRSAEDYDEGEEREDESDDDGTGVKAHKSVVGPDEIVPAQEQAVAKAEKLAGTRTLLMWLPALFDICGTTLMNVGLLWVPVSVYQMLRGALVLWVGLFSVLFLHRKLPADQWASLFIVMLGVAVVGLSNVFTGESSPSSSHKTDLGKAVIGALLVLFAQVFTASQFVIEEKIMTRYSVQPLKAVGLEGIFGMSTTLFLMPILYFTLGHASSSNSTISQGNGGYFDIPNGFSETFNNRIVWITSIMIAFSIAFFNFSGLAVTKSVSATARSLIDTCRTIGIWIVSLYLGWEQLAYLQIVGFTLLVYGTLCFNNVISFPSFLGFRSDSHDNSTSAHAPSSSSSSSTTKYARPNNGKLATRPSYGRVSSDDAQDVVIIHRNSERTPLLGSSPPS